MFVGVIDQPTSSQWRGWVPTICAWCSNWDSSESIIPLYRRIDKLEESFNSSLEFESKRISELESRIKELENITTLLDKADKQLSDHSEKINKLERFSRRNNVRTIGLPQDKNEDCMVIVSKLLTDRFDMPNIQLERAHRDGPKTPGRRQYLLVKFNGYQDKIKVLRLQRQVLGDQSFFCVDDLTCLDLQEKRRWSEQVRRCYHNGKKYRFVAGKWRDNTGALA